METQVTHLQIRSDKKLMISNDLSEFQLAKLLNINPAIFKRARNHLDENVSPTLQESNCVNQQK